MANQFGRKASLIVSTGTKGLDLSQMRFTFRTECADVQTPNVLIARIYNLKKETVQKIGTEFTVITLQAGYENGISALSSKARSSRPRREGCRAPTPTSTYGLQTGMNGTGSR